MAGHSHWAGIKHKKGRQDKLRSKIFSKISREITVAAKLGSKDPGSNHRLRAAIESAKDANMPKDNISRAISKSEIDKDKNFENLRYEGFGPKNIALIIETLTENKNRTAGSIRTIFQKHGGNLGSTGSTTHFFSNCGVIRLSKKDISEEKFLELAVAAGSKDCASYTDFHEIITNKDDFYKVKNRIEKSINNLIYSGIEWRANNFVDISEGESIEFEKMLEMLQEDDDIQKIFHNCKIV